MSTKCCCRNDSLWNTYLHVSCCFNNDANPVSFTLHLPDCDVSIRIFFGRDFV